MISDLNGIKCVVIDVDGTLTDSGIYYDENGNELKKFSTFDAAAFFVAHKLGIEVMVLTGRKCKATEKRMKELGVSLLFQNVKDKVSFLAEYMKKAKISSDELGYIGDDLNDYAPMKLASFKACPANSCKEIKEIADYVSPVNGGCGAVRDIFENCIVKSQWSYAIKQVYAGI